VIGEDKKPLVPKGAVRHKLESAATLCDPQQFLFCSLQHTIGRDLPADTVILAAGTLPVEHPYKIDHFPALRDPILDGLEFG